MDWSVEADGGVAVAVFKFGGLGFDDIDGFPGNLGHAAAVKLGAGSRRAGAWGFVWFGCFTASTGGCCAIGVVMPLSVDGGVGSVDVIFGDGGAGSIGFGVPTKEHAVFLHWVGWEGDFAIVASGFAGCSWGSGVVEVEGDFVLWSNRGLGSSALGAAGAASGWGGATGGWGLITGA